VRFVVSLNGSCDNCSAIGFSDQTEILRLDASKWRTVGPETISKARLVFAIQGAL